MQGQEQGQEAEAAPQQEQGLDLTPLLERMDGIGGRLDSFEERFADRFADQQPEQQDDSYDDFDVDGMLDSEGDMDPQAARQLLSQIVDQRTSKAVQEAVGPLMNQLQDMQIGLDADALAQRYPELSKPEVAEPVVQAARQLAEQMDQPELARSPQFIEVVYKSQMADKYAAGEVPVGDEQQFDLESAAGSGPQGVESNIAERIVAARGRKSGFDWGA